ncbi:MAG: hypothetical protein ABI680_12490 [Chthoniobacteraceae bacterium]
MTLLLLRPLPLLLSSEVENNGTIDWSRGMNRRISFIVLVIDRSVGCQIVEDEDEKWL